MKHIDFIRSLSLTLATIAVVGVIAVGPVAAESGSDDSTSSSSGSGSTSETSSGSGRRSGSDDHKLVTTTTTTVKTEDDGTVETEHTGDDSSTLRQKAKDLLVQKRETVKEHTTEQKKKSCEARSANLDKKITNYGRNASKHLEVFNSIYAKVQKFHDTKQLAAADYDSLKATADAKKTAATDAVKALQAVSVNIDCTSADPASSVATVKEAVKNARTALQEYRKAIKDVVVALQSAKSAANSTDEKPTDDNTTTNTSGN